MTQEYCRLFQRVNQIPYDSYKGNKNLSINQNGLDTTLHIESARLTI